MTFRTRRRFRRAQRVLRTAFHWVASPARLLSTIAFL